MTRSGRVAAFSGAALAAGAVVFAGLSARAAESFLHPVRRSVAPVCPCVAHVHCGDAMVVSTDGTHLKGWYYEPDQPNGAAVILLHGIGGNREDLVGLGVVFEKAGYRVLLPDLRGHGTSDGLTTLGVRESDDVHAWADWMLLRSGVNRIYGFGVSLGGSVLLESLDREKRFRAVVAESAFTTFPDVAVERISRGLPGPVKWLAFPFVDTALLWTRIRYGADLKTGSPLQSVKRTNVPVLLIHGRDDPKTEAEHSRKLAAANRGVTDLWLVPGAGQANSLVTAKVDFDRRVLAWFDSR